MTIAELREWIKDMPDNAVIKLTDEYVGVEVWAYSGLIGSIPL